MPKIITITCDVCGQPAKQTFPYDNLFLCEKHQAVRELEWVKEELQAKIQWFNETWKDVLEEQIKQLETIINANSN